ncbi:hypothetical protein MPH61_12450 [Peribacillus muralis]|uniref:hypothetical protein n=1 Tax=Peribacillus muralis TaxID=264697 RepID=UPI001F4E8D65|nr:hypothetical protein [Peribacillus muralis]MCK1993756.1 hypothetical protein [Peribacillus muralis]MCK2013955.1 hypothetical protein [Peribacillus muralis]
MNCSCSDQEQIFHLLRGLNNQISRPKLERCTGINSSRYELLHQLYETEEINQSTMVELWKHVEATESHNTGEHFSAFIQKAQASFHGCGNEPY